MQNKTPHVIVCDDDVELNSFIRSHFKLDGYETHQALSAKEECQSRYLLDTISLEV